MGHWTTYCSFCGGPPPGIDAFEEILEALEDDVGDDDDWKDIYKILKQAQKWLKKWGALLENGKYISASAGDYDGAGSIKYKNYNVNIDKLTWDLPGKRAIMAHKACYDLAMKKKKINWFIVVSPYLSEREGPPGYIKGINYGEIADYAEQTYAYYDLIGDLVDPWFLEDPTKNAKNRKRIEGILTKILKKKKRPSPLESATKFPVGTKRKGGDDKMWIVKKNVKGIKQWRRL